MYFIQVKGRGYFNGNTTHIISSTMGRGYIFSTIQNDIDETILIKPHFKRKCEDLDPKFAFTSKECAQIQIDTIKNQILLETMSYDLSRGAKCTVLFDLSELKPIVDKMQIVESDAYSVNKKTYKGARKTNLRSQRMIGPAGTRRACNICQVAIDLEEPYVSVGDEKICVQCLTPIYEDANLALNSHAKGQLWKDARDTEIVTRAL